MHCSVFVVFLCSLLVIEVSCSSPENEKVDDSALQVLLRRIHEQDEKIAILEAMRNRDRKEFKTQLLVLETKIRRSESRQNKLVKTIQRLQEIIFSKPIIKTLSENVDNKTINENLTGKIKRSTVSSLSKHCDEDKSNPKDIPGRSKQKRILTGGVSPTHTVAFYSYLSKFERSPGVHHTVIFDTVITNVGSSYNHHDGIFTAPTNGVYVFNWNLYSAYHGEIMSELMVNSASKGIRLSSGSTVNEDHSSSGTVLVEISQGDVVYVRTHATFGPVGSIVSYADLHQSSFCGWLLV